MMVVDFSVAVVIRVGGDLILMPYVKRQLITLVRAVKRRRDDCTT